MNSSWSPEAIERLRQLANSGLSFSQIAAIYSREQGREFTRNMVQGVCFRHGITSKYVKPAPVKAPPQAPVGLKGGAGSEPKPLGKPGDIPPSGRCRFIRGEMTPSFRMCGHPTDNGGAWCMYHRMIVLSGQTKAVNP